MKQHQLHDALHAVCERFDGESDVEVLVVGGAAGMLTHLLSEDRVTNDCDIMVYDPGSALGRVEVIAERVGSELGLPERWFNSDIALRSDLLPDGWKTRRILVAQGPKIRIFAADRLDLIAMKVFAHRAQDLEDLVELKLTADDIRFVRSYLGGLHQRGTPKDAISEAREILESWQVQ